jgi:hypothetical protein
MGTRTDAVKRHRTAVSFGVATLTIALGAGVVGASPAGATDRFVMTTTTSTHSGGVLLALAGAVIVLGTISYFVISRTRRTRRPERCSDQREALELAERAVKYWEGARSHMEAVAKQRTTDEGGTDDATSHASQLTKVHEGLSAAVEQRDQRQLDLIRCMASAGGPVPVVPSTPLEPLPYILPGTDTPKFNSSNND